MSGVLSSNRLKNRLVFSSVSGMPDENSIKELAAGLRGSVIGPDDNDYEQARKVYNAMIHKKPRWIVRCADAADVIRSINFAREQDLLVSVRGGGHNAGGLGICDELSHRGKISRK